MPSPSTTGQSRPLTLRLIAESDLDQVLALDQTALGGLWNRDGYRRELDNDTSALLGLWTKPRSQGDDVGEGQLTECSTDQGARQLIGLGCTWFIVDEAHITAIAVDPQYQRQGLGQLLLLALLQTSHRQGMKRATLEVNCNNFRAIALYEKFGFKQVGIRKKYYSNGDSAAILWLNRLDWPQFIDTLQQWETTVSDRLKKHQWIPPSLESLTITSPGFRPSSDMKSDEK
ncbi:MAG: ribosomal protein S18-alanine N-acetyltransferase [Cyanobacteria bacterium P01_F01_bin.153]